jgi:hypothetical protein
MLAAGAAAALLHCGDDEGATSSDSGPATSSSGSSTATGTASGTSTSASTGAGANGQGGSGAGASGGGGTAGAGGGGGQQSYLPALEELEAACAAAVPAYQFVRLLTDSPDSFQHNTESSFWVHALAGDDAVDVGNAAQSCVFGGDGDDTITVTGSGTTTVWYGAAGADRFQLDPQGVHVTLADFESGSDVVAFHDAPTEGLLNIDDFDAGSMTSPNEGAGFYTVVIDVSTADGPDAEIWFASNVDSTQENTHIGSIVGYTVFDMADFTVVASF